MHREGETIGVVPAAGYRSGHLGRDMNWGNTAPSNPDLAFSNGSKPASPDVVTRLDLAQLFEAGAVDASIEPRMRSLNQILPECRVAVLSFVHVTRRVLAILGS